MRQNNVTVFEAQWSLQCAEDCAMLPYEGTRVVGQDYREL